MDSAPKRHGLVVDGDDVVELRFGFLSLMEWLVAAFQMPRLGDSPRARWDAHWIDRWFEAWTARLQEAVWLFDFSSRQLSTAADAFVAALAPDARDDAVLGLSETRN